MRPGSYLALALVAILGTACQAPRAENYLQRQGLEQPTVNEFQVCASAGCRNISTLSYTDDEWNGIRAFFEPIANSPADEREQIANAVAAMETIIGAKNGTSADRPMNKRQGLNEGQLDCIAEAVNTTVALILLQSEGLLRHHRVGFPAHRGFVQLRLPHNTATIHEIDGPGHYTVDSWFLANGGKPMTVPVDSWRSGYSPYKPNPYHEPLQLH